jgi:hypothetical protein
MQLIVIGIFFMSLEARITVTLRHGVAIDTRYPALYVALE